MNDYATVGHTVAGKIAAAVWGDKSFKRPIHKFKLIESEEHAKSINNRVLENLKAKGVI